jgi:hypothetical protein
VSKDNEDLGIWRGTITEKVENIENIVQKMDGKMDNFVETCNEHKTSITLLQNGQTNQIRWNNGHEAQHKDAEKTKEKAIVLKQEMSTRRFGMIIGLVGSFPVAIQMILKYVFHFPI